jgi:hypothetical protein
MEPANPIPPSKPEPTGGNSKPAWIVAIIMALTAGAFGYLYFTQDTATSPPDGQAIDETADQNQTEDEVSLTIYQAEIGKFKLNLADDYGIVENLDAGFEGGPATSIELGTVSNDARQVVITNPAQAFTIFARPESGATLANNSRTAALEADELTERQADITFADTPARVYRGDGLFIVKHIVFVKNGIVYEVTMLNEDQTQADMLEAVESGWNFVE